MGPDALAAAGPEHNYCYGHPRLLYLTGYRMSDIRSFSIVSLFHLNVAGVFVAIDLNVNARRIDINQ